KHSGLGNTATANSLNSSHIHFLKVLRNISTSIKNKPNVPKKIISGILSVRVPLTNESPSQRANRSCCSEPLNLNSIVITDCVENAMIPSALIQLSRLSYLLDPNEGSRR